MKKFFTISLLAIAMIATTMISCKKEIDITYNDVTENTVTFKVTDYKTSNPVAGAVMKNSDGEAVATTGSNGLATYTKRLSDNLIFTVEANGYATMFTSGGNVVMHKTNVKASGIATYTDKYGGLNIVPAGTELSVLSGLSLVQRVFKTTVSSEGKFEFNALPEGSDMYFVAPIEINKEMYGTYGSFYTNNSTVSTIVNFYYINDNDIPFAVISRPGVVKATEDIVMIFNKEVDTEYQGNSLYVYGYGYNDYTTEWSSDKKTLRIKTNSNWGDVNTTFGIDYSFYTPPGANGIRQNVSDWWYVRIIE